jgi:hypothetical protein
LTGSGRGHTIPPARILVRSRIRTLEQEVETPFVTRAHGNSAQPRTGLAYAYRPKGVVRAGFGIVHDRQVGLKVRF